MLHKFVKNTLRGTVNIVDERHAQTINSKTEQVCKLLDAKALMHDIWIDGKGSLLCDAISLYNFGFYVC